jgi:hypothetical protein
MRIADLFAKDPCRRIEPIIRAGERDPEILGHELDEYVVTEETDRYLRDILGQFIQSRPGHQPDGVCAWVSGWFGSGKSHFLKFLGAILGNLPLKLPSGAEVGATSYLCGKWSLPFEAHLKELTTKVIFVNLLGYVSGETPGLSEIVYRGFMVESGYADEPWLGEMERFLARRGLYERFRQEVEVAAGLPWSEVRAQPGPAFDFMARALIAIDPDTWPSRAYAERAIERQGRIQLNPNWLASRLKAEAEALNLKTGRLVMLLDEVGLYIGDQQDRYLELKAIADNVAGADIFGKVWLVVTSQEAPELKIQAIVAKREELEWLRDRFPLKFALTPENIETVVRQRLLKKTLDGAAAVRSAVADEIGALSLGATITGARRNREIFEPPDTDHLVETFPFLPYQVRLTTQILAQLRGRGVGAEGLSGRERAILAVAQSALCSGGLATREIWPGGGAPPLVTFERLFDAIVGDTRAVPSAHEAEIRELARLGSKGGVPVQAVAKALYLLQQVSEWVPATAENLAAVLYPSLGSRGEEVAGGVRAALAELVDRHYVGEQEGVFRFLAPMERTFEEDITRARRDITAAQRRRLALEVLRELLAEFTKHRFQGGIRVFDVKLNVDGDVVDPRGYLLLIVQSPLATVQLDPDEIERTTSPGSRDTIWWLTEQSAEVSALVDRILAMEAVLGRPEAGGPEGSEFRREREREKETLRHTTLPSRLRQSLARGILLAVGTRRTPMPDDWEQAIRTAIQERAEEVFYEFSAGAASVRDEDVGRILTWRGGALPEVFRTLLVVENASIREDSPLLSRLLGELKRRANGHESLHGPDLVDHFDRPPYGWDERVTRLGLACLFRNGSIEVRTAQGTFRSPKDASAVRALTNRPAFRQASFHPTQVLTEEQRRAARDLVAEWFNAIRETPEEIDDALRQGFSRAERDATTLATRLADFRLGGAEVLRGLAERVREILDLATPTSRLLAALESSTREQVGFALSLLKALQDWEKAAGFERSAEILEFLTAAIGLENSLKERLRTLFATDDLPKIWPELYQTYQAAVTSYTDAYRQSHSELRSRVAACVAELEGNPEISLFQDDLAKLRALGCAEVTPDVRTPPFACLVCRRSIPDLQRDYFAAGDLRSRIIRQIQAQRVVHHTKAGHLEPFYSKATLTTSEEVQDLATGLHAYAEQALKEGPIEVEISATPQKEDA